MIFSAEHRRQPASLPADASRPSRLPVKQSGIKALEMPGVKGGDLIHAHGLGGGGNIGIGKFHTRFARQADRRKHGGLVG